MNSDGGKYVAAYIMIVMLVTLGFLVGWLSHTVLVDYHREKICNV